MRLEGLLKFELFLLFSSPQATRKGASAKGAIVEPQIGISAFCSLASQEILCVTFVKHSSIPDEMYFRSNNHLAIHGCSQVIATVHQVLAILKNGGILTRTRRSLYQHRSGSLVGPLLKAHGSQQALAGASLKMDPNEREPK